MNHLLVYKCKLRIVRHFLKGVWFLVMTPGLIVHIVQSLILSSSVMKMYFRGVLLKIGGFSFLLSPEIVLVKS